MLDARVAIALLTTPSAVIVGVVCTALVTVVIGFTPYGVNVVTLEKRSPEMEAWRMVRNVLAFLVVLVVLGWAAFFFTVVIGSLVQGFYGWGMT